jgi:hypothetical protein
MKSNVYCTYALIAEVKNEFSVLRRRLRRGKVERQTSRQKIVQKSFKNFFLNTLRGFVPAYIPIFLYDFIKFVHTDRDFLCVRDVYVTLQIYVVYPFFQKILSNLLVIVLRVNPARLPVMRERTRIICTISR